MKNFKTMTNFELCAYESQLDASISHAMNNMVINENLQNLFDELEQVKQEKKSRGLTDNGEVK